jgi:hypothetical protein
MRRLASILAALGLLLAVSAAPTFAGNGPPHLAFYVDGNPTPYRTVGTPTDLSNTGAPASSFDKLYALGGNGLLDVAEAAPGDTDYNGGRWMVFPVTWNVTPYQLFSEDEVLAAAAAGDLTIASSPAKMFVCPVIPS